MVTGIQVPWLTHCGLIGHFDLLSLALTRLSKLHTIGYNPHYFNSSPPTRIYALANRVNIGSDNDWSPIRPQPII